MVRAIAAAGELSCGEVVERFELSQATVSHHLKVLSDAGVVSVRPCGRFHYFSIHERLAETFRDVLAGVLPSRPAEL